MASSVAMMPCPPPPDSGELPTLPRQPAAPVSAPAPSGVTHLRSEGRALCPSCFDLELDDDEQARLCARHEREAEDRHGADVGFENAVFGR